MQLDFVQPRRLGLSYTASSGRSETPFCIHRAPFSTHERMVAFLAELYEGAFPTWLAPVQVLVVPVSDRVSEYAQGIVARLRAAFVRAQLAPASETVAKNIRLAVEHRVPNVAVVGPTEQRNATVTLRRYGIAEQTQLGLEAFERALRQSIERRAKDLRL